MVQLQGVNLRFTSTRNNNDNKDKNDNNGKNDNNDDSNDRDVVIVTTAQAKQ